MVNALSTGAGVDYLGISIRMTADEAFFLLGGGYEEFKGGHGHADERCGAE